MILAVDPGDTTGIALFDEAGELKSKDQLKFDDFLEMLANTKAETIIVEDYRLFKGKQAQQTGSRFQAVQVIGAIKYHTYLHEGRFELVTVQAKIMGSMYSGIKAPSDHKRSHSVDAYNIGIYWLVKEGIIDPPSLKDLAD